MYSGGSGRWEDDPNPRGWWGDDPPFHHDVFVLTHHAREPLEMEGGTTFHFVTDGSESALEQAMRGGRRQGRPDPRRRQRGLAAAAAGLLDELTSTSPRSCSAPAHALLDDVPPGSSSACESSSRRPGVIHIRYAS